MTSDTTPPEGSEQAAALAAPRPPGVPSLSERLAMLAPALSELDELDDLADDDDGTDADAGGAAVAAPAAEPTPAAPPPPVRRPHVRLSLPLIALLVLTVLMAVATSYLWLQVREHTRTETARQQALDASRDAARLLFSYDYRTLDRDFSLGRTLTTGQFRSEYARTTTRAVTDVAKQYHAVVRANVVTAGVVSASPKRVVTIVYVNKVTNSTRVVGQKVDLSRVRVTLQKVGDHWLVAKVDAL